MAKIFKSLVPRPARPPQPAADGRKPAAPVDRDKLARATPGNAAPASPDAETCKPKEIGGPEGPEPTRYGDWERGGICYDF